jgi:hypothetical protein
MRGRSKVATTATGEAVFNDSGGAVRCWVGGPRPSGPLSLVVRAIANALEALTGAGKATPYPYPPFQACQP